MRAVSTTPPVNSSNTMGCRNTSTAVSLVTAVIPEAVVESLRARQDPDTGACARRSQFTPGAPVEFRAGPFAGLEGVYEMEASHERVYVLLELLGKLNKVPVARDWLVPVA